jgi:hypothetical protein
MKKPETNILFSFKQLVHELRAENKMQWQKQFVGA